MNNLLFPRMFRIVGWVLFIPALILGVLTFFNVFKFSGITGTVCRDITIIGVALGSLFIVCSKEQCEDEMTRSIRLASLLNSLYIYVLLLISGTIMMSGTEFLVFKHLNMILFPIIYVNTFTLERRRYNKMKEEGEE